MSQFLQGCPERGTYNSHILLPDLFSCELFTVTKPETSDKNQRDAWLGQFHSPQTSSTGIMPPTHGSWMLPGPWMAPNTAGVGTGFPREGVGDGRSRRVGVSLPTCPRTRKHWEGRHGPGKPLPEAMCWHRHQELSLEESPAWGHTRRPNCPALSPGPNSS